MSELKMTHGIVALGALGIALAVAPVASAHDKGRGAAMHHEFQMMDTNNDGKVSADEHAAGAKKMFETMDADKDGKVTASEMEASHEQVTGKKAKKFEMTAAEKIKVIDGNGDGTLTAAEHAAGAKTMFEKMDANKDGFLTKHELMAGHKMMHKESK
jgi:Ca2+-binding EF-hand superfamily protein